MIPTMPLGTQYMYMFVYLHVVRAFCQTQYMYMFVYLHVVRASTCFLPLHAVQPQDAKTTHHSVHRQEDRQIQGKAI